MDQKQTETLSLKTAYTFGADHGLQQQVDEIRNMEIEWDLNYTSTVRRGYIVELFEKHRVFEEFKRDCWTFGNTPSGESKRRRYLRMKKQYEDFLAGTNVGQLAANDEAADEESEQQFAAESDLRDFLAKNLACIESGLELYQNDGKSGVEFPIDNGFIDILAVDQKKQFVVVELKVGKGRNKTVGQLLYYMGWVDKNLGKGPCRGMIIAKEIPDDLLLTVQRIPGLSLARYHLSVSVETVKHIG